MNPRHTQTSHSLHPPAVIYNKHLQSKRGRASLDCQPQMFPSSSAHGVLDHSSNTCDEYLPEDASLSASRTHPLFASYVHFSPAIDHADPFLPQDTADLLASHFHHPIFSPRANTAGSAYEGVNHAVVDIPTETVAATHDKGGMPEMNFFSPRNPNSSNSHLGAGRKRSGMKKDRHSKILTAQGPRDRRMRLSLEVAPKFFSLQNMLGFDTGSKTVGWLLSKSEPAIRELYLAASQTKGGKSICSPSEGEVVSGIDEIAETDQDLLQESEERSLAAAGINSKSKKARSSKRTTPLHPVAKEWRAEARARARERAKEKKKKVDGNLLDQPKAFKLGNLAFSALSSAEAVNSNSNELVSFPNNDMISIFREHWNNIDHNTRTAPAFDAAAASIHSTSYTQEQVSNPLLEMTVGSRLPSQFSNI